MASQGHPGPKCIKLPNGQLRVRSALVRRVYDLRHACISTWLNGGIAPAQVAEWAGHSVAILLRICAKCVDGQDDIARRRIEEALGDPGEDDTPEPSPQDNDAGEG